MVANSDPGERPQALVPVFDAIPSALRAMPTWVLWRYELNPKKKKWTKPPLTVKRRPASTTNPTTWTTFDRAVEAYQRGDFDGIGTVVTDGITGADLDHAIDAGKTPAPWAKEVLDHFAGTYRELSPGGSGYRIFTRGTPARCGKGGPDNNLEVYAKKSPRYLTVTGHALAPAAEIVECQPALDWLHAKYMTKRPQRDTDEMPAQNSPNLTDDEILDKARKAKNGTKFMRLFGGDAGPDHSSADLALIGMLHFYSQDAAQLDRLFRRSGLMRPKWDEARGPSTYGADTIAKVLREGGAIYGKGKDAAKTVSVDDFYAYMPMHQYIFVPTRELWPASSVDRRITPWPKTPVSKQDQAPSNWLDANRPIEQMTWQPGEPQIVRDRVIQVGGWVPHLGTTVFNLYRPPARIEGDATKAGPWIDHVVRIYPDDADHIIRWLAHRVQRPGEKVNHAIVLGGAQGIGKDTLLEPVKAGIGPWNWQEINPAQMLGRFNAWAKAVIVRVSEARDLGDVDRFKFYDHCKVYLAAPPDVLRVDEKFLREHYIANVLGVVITTNHAGDGLYLPADDRRHYVAWSERCKDDFPKDYWVKLYGWYAQGGIGHVVAYLRDLDLSVVDWKAPPLQTPAFWNNVATGEAPESGELRDVIDGMDNPAAVTLEQVIDRAMAMSLGGLADELRDRKNRRSVPHKLDRVGYVPVRNPDADDGLFVVNERRKVVYAKRSLPLAEQVRAARRVGT